MILMTSFDHLRMLNQSIAAVYSNRWSVTFHCSTDNLGFVITATNTGINLLQLKHRIGLSTSVNDTYVAVAISV